MKEPVLYGLIGYPLEHSFSPGYFNAKFLREDIAATYQTFPIKDIKGFPELLVQHPNLAGLNVTIPHKESVINFLDEVHVDAAEVGAVNCISIRHGKTIGYNTDVFGFEQSLQPLLTRETTSAIVLGTGGAAKAVKWVLQKSGIDYLSVSRTTKTDAIAYSDLTIEEVKKRKLVINTTPLGMYPVVENSPAIPYQAIGNKHLLYDLIYNPVVSSFLKKGTQQGATIKNGLDMLHLQAEAAWKLWNP